MTLTERFTPRLARRARRPLWRVCLVLALSISAPVVAIAQSQPPDLTKASLEDLLNTQVTSVSKKDQKLLTAGAAIFVISQEDIRRSGATNIPDLLRMVPGVDVAQIDANSWAISIRGFNDLYADKVLVLIDGRSVYRSTFSGVSWDEMDMPLEDIDRIEVIRGPGGTVWGANAANGVINIITKSSKDTKGGLVSAGTGSEALATGLVQYGGSIGSSGTYRVFAKYFDIGSSSLASGGHAADSWHGFHEGFRSDWTLSSKDTLTVEGDSVVTREGQTLSNVINFNTLPAVTPTLDDRIQYNSGDFLGRWDHLLSNGSDMTLQVYDDYYFRDAQGLRETGKTIDLDFQHHVNIGSRNDLVWGLGYRAVTTDFARGFNVDFLPNHRTDNLFSVFVQDQIRLTNSLSLVVGSKFENNAYTGYESEPSAQLVWQATDHHTLWASAAKAVRQPARRDLGLLVDAAIIPLDNGGVGVLQLMGTPNPKAEQIRDFEIGHRAQITKRLSVDSTVFLSLYHHLTSSEPLAPVFTVADGQPLLIFPVIFDYKAYAHNYGAEFFATWNITDRLKISPGFSMLHLNAKEDPGSPGAPLENPGNSPRHEFEIRSLFNVTRRLEWDSSLSFVGSLIGVPSYARLDTRLGWHVGESVELSVAGQNLLSPRHAEFLDEYFITQTQIERSVVAKVTWRF